MANKSISQLTAGGAVSGTDLFPDVQTAGVGPVKVTATQLATFFWYQPTLVAPALGAATATSINIGGATLGSNVLAVNGTTLLGGATTVSTGGLTIGVAGTTGGTIALKGSTAGTLTLQVPATVTDYSITLPSAVAAGNGYILTSTTGGVTSWTNPTSLGIDLDVGTTAITNGTTGRVLYDNAGVLGEYTAVPVGFGGTGTSTAFTAGSVVFAGASGVYSQDNANFFWDDTNNRLGIGTTTPTVALGVVDTGNTFCASFRGSGSTDIVAIGTTAFGASINGYTAGFAAPADLVLQPNGGNLGLGVTPSAWASPFTKAFEIGTVGSIATTTNSLRFSNNAYYGSLGWTYKNTAAAAHYDIIDNTHSWYNAASGTAGAAITFTQAMTLDASGNLGVGVSPSYKLDVSNAGANTIAAVRSAAGFASYLSLAGNATTPLSTSFDLIFDGTAYLYNRSSGAMVFGTNNSERARFAATTATLSIGTSAATNPGSIQLYGSTSGSSTITVAAVAGSSTWTFQNPGGNVNVGYLNLPPVGTKTSSYQLATADVGKYVQVSTGGAITIPDATFAEGDIISIFNNTSGNITITCSITTAYIAGTDTDKATMTLATRGVATVLFISSTVCVVSGNVS